MQVGQRAGRWPLEQRELVEKFQQSVRVKNQEARMVELGIDN
jgi:hypothetical protein